ncbi:hypothetical protein K1T71_004078 [Dendrolimus kikuchii]|uniref:Uncharacterized protein n=1 Tax=Dendrolimus kikuchii TaxID=765133 RepID=A0ACC1D9T6_9NEOP|nr:hypothetical protein K1T71_004078 [Dendrolimus kikuchii]
MIKWPLWNSIYYHSQNISMRTQGEKLTRVVLLFRSLFVSLANPLMLLRKAFEAFDHEKRGCIGTVMVGTILGMLGHSVTDDSLKEIIEEVDEDGSGELEFEEFVILASRFMVEEDAEAMQQELKEAFRLYDKEGNGYITTKVLREILRELDDKISAEELDMMIEEIDSDGSGTVDFDEFMEVMTGGDD